MRISARASSGEHRDEADVDAQDVGQLARQALEHAGALGARDGERRRG
jgi:hypothetical protein